jgi:hypothetical protein
MIDERLLGKWESVPDAAEEPVTIEFAEDGSLTYTIHTDHTDQIMLLRYRTDRGVIISDQPSQPREEQTRYRFTADERLIMTYEGEESIYSRAKS